MQPQVETVLKKLEAEDDNKTLLHLVQLFWFVEETKTLLYVQKRIRDLNPQPLELSKIDFKAASSIESVSLLGVLRAYQYSNADNLDIAVELILDYAEKLPHESPSIIHLFSENMGFQHTSYRTGYHVPRAIERLLWKRTEDGAHEVFSRFYLAVITNFLHISFHTNELRGDIVHIYDFELSKTPEILSLRQDMWSRLFTLYHKSSLAEATLGVISSYCVSIHGLKNKEVLTSDAEQLLTLFSNHLKPQNYAHCLLVHDFLSLLDRFNIAYDKSLGHHFENEAFKLSKVLFSNRLEKKELELGDEEYQDYLKQRIAAHFAEYVFDDYKAFFDLCQVIIAHSDDNKPHQFQMRVEQVFLALAAQYKELYANVFEHYLNLGDPLSLLYIYRPLRALIDVRGVEYTKSVIANVDMAVRNKWFFSFYISLLPNEVTSEHLAQLLNLYTSAALEDIPQDPEYLNKYQRVDESVFSKVIHLILDKAEEEPRYAFTLERLFNPYSTLYDKMPEIFADDVELLKKAYTAVMKVESHIDHDGKTLTYIIDRDKNFITEFVSQLFPEEGFHGGYKEGHVDFSFIWRRGDYPELMERTTHFIYEWEQKRYRYMTSSLEAFFARRSDSKNDEILFERQDTFLLKLIAENFANNQLIDMAFGVIAEFAPERRLKFVKQFLDKNASFERFRLLQIEPHLWSWSGSQVPMLESRAEYLKSLLPFLNTMELLEHKQYLEQRIRAIREDVEGEKRRDFLDDRF